MEGAWQSCLILDFTKMDDLYFKQIIPQNYRTRDGNIHNEIIQGAVRFLFSGIQPTTATSVRPEARQRQSFPLSLEMYHFAYCSWSNFPKYPNRLLNPISVKLLIKHYCNWEEFAEASTWCNILNSLRIQNNALFRLPA